MTLKAQIILYALVMPLMTGAQDLNNLRISLDDLDNIIFQQGIDGQELDQSYSFPIVGVGNGMHRLYVEVQDESGVWSLFATQVLLVEGTTSMAVLTNAEYYFDVDPGVGNGIPMLMISGAAINADVNIPTTGLSPGLHRLNVRVQDGATSWSLASDAAILIEGGPGFEDLVYGEYFIGADPGQGLGTSFIATMAASVETQLNIPLDPLFTPGTYALHARVRDGFGQWSQVATSLFEVVDDLICPYDLNNDDEINVSDFLLLMGAYGSSGPSAADYDNNGVVNVMDLLMLSGYFGTVCTAN